MALVIAPKAAQNCAMITLDWLLAVTLYGFATSGTPGPNNIMLMASGVNFGLRRSLPHIMGITCGFMFMLALTGLGLGALFTALPPLETLLRLGATAYLLWLAWKIAGSGAPGGAGRTRAAQPLSFLQAAAFQWINPKAWMICMSVVPIYAPGQEWQRLSVLVLMTGLTCLPSSLLWAAAGTGLSHWLQEPKRLRIFNWLMAGLLVASLVPMLAD